MLALAILVPGAAAGQSFCWYCYLDQPDPPRWGCITYGPGGYQNCMISQGGRLCTVSSPCTEHGCFLAGTPVMTPRGAVDIATLRTGDVVISRDGRGRVREARVGRTFRTIASRYLVLNGSIRMTGSHPVMSSGTWTESADIEVGDLIAGAVGPVRIDALEWVETPVRVYNIEVLGTSTYFAAGLLVHNKPEVQALCH
jgi:hypothetical protein